MDGNVRVLLDQHALPSFFGNRTPIFLWENRPSLTHSPCSLSGNSHIPTLLQEWVHEPGQAHGSTSLRCTRLVQRWHVTLTRPTRGPQGNPKEPGKRHHCLLLLTAHDLRPHTPWASDPPSKSGESLSSVKSHRGKPRNRKKQ